MKFLISSFQSLKGISNSIFPNFYQQRGYIKAGLKAASTLNNPAIERQEGLLLERVPLKYLQVPATSIENQNGESKQKFISFLETTYGLQRNSITENDILFQKSRLGKYTGRVCVLTTEMPALALSNVTDEGVRMKLCDANDVESFVEQCERFDKQSEDLRWLAQPENFKKLVTLTDIPKAYGRREVRDLLQQHAQVNVPLKNIVFRFKRHGAQSDMVWVVCNSEKEANHVISTIKEVAVPKRVQYGNLFGCSFIWASRLSLFVQDDSLDYLLLKEDPNREKFQVFTTGWHGDVSKEDFEALMQELRLGCYGSTQYTCPISGKNSFFMQCTSMQHAKRTMTSLNLLKRRWRMNPNDAFYAYPRAVDVHWADQDRYREDDNGDDSDIDEPIHY